MQQYGRCGFRKRALTGPSLEKTSKANYIWGNKGIQVNDDLAVDFKVLSRPGAERICRAAFEFAKANGKTNVTVVTKANIVKLVDGNFIKMAHAWKRNTRALRYGKNWLTPWPPN